MKKTAFFLLIITLLTCGLSFAEEPEEALSADFLYGRGVQAFFSDDYTAAADLFEQASGLDQDNPVYLYFLGLCQFRSGQTDEARGYFVAAAESELTPRGALIYVPGHLRRIQGNERVLIEDVRKEVRQAWEEKERKRQIALYGDFIDRHRQQLCGDSTDVASSATESELAKPEDPSLPMVPPIRPLKRPEIDGSISETLAQYGIREVVHLKEEFVTDEFGNVLKDDQGNPILKTSLSTAEQKRLTLSEKKKKEQAEAEASFVDIFSEDEVSSDNTAFGGETEEEAKNKANAPSQGTAADQVISSIFGNQDDDGNQLAKDGNADETESGENAETENDTDSDDGQTDNAPDAGDADSDVETAESDAGEE